MTDHTPQQESWRKRLRNLDFLNICGEVDDKTLEAFISSERIRLLDGVKAVIQNMGTYRTVRNIECVGKHDLLKALDTLGEK